jgi:hypothetical protein
MSKTKIKTSPWPFLAQKGFGLLEVLTAILVFVLLVYVGSRAFRGVVQNHKAASQVTTMSDLVSSTAEGLSAIGVQVLTRTGSAYLQWSKPEMVGKGPMYYRYRIVPRPTIGGKQDSTVAGLQLEAGTLEGGKFTPNRNFAALVSPHLASLNADGGVTTEAERQLEAQFYASLRQQISSAVKKAPAQSETYLNSYSCYDKGECCDFMRRFMADTSLRPKDGLDQKCHHRCALAGDVSMDAWKKACGTDFCRLAPWKTKAQCCEAINSGHCPPGSLCAQVCVGCVGENGSGCPWPKCDIFRWNDYIDCASGTLCDGSPLPDGDIPGWGYVKGICKLPSCQTLRSDCGYETKQGCCENYWGKLAMGETPSVEHQICGQITKKSDCCNFAENRGHFELKCGSDGTMQAALHEGVLYCRYNQWDKYCAVQRGCPATSYPNFDNHRGNVICVPTPPGGWKSSPYEDPTPVVVPPGGGWNNGGGAGVPLPPASIGSGKNNSRTPTNRSGGGFGSWGGRE